MFQLYIKYLYYITLYILKTIGRFNRLYYIYVPTGNVSDLLIFVKRRGCRYLYRLI